MVAEEVRTGRVLAMQGGFDSIGASYNRATQALRQPGSAFKPIVYETALENGMTPASIIVDAPFCVWQGAGLGNKCFVNFDRRYPGAKTMRWGVEQSRNLMTIRAASQTGMAKVTDTAAQARRRRLSQLSVDRARRRRHHGAQADQRLCDPRQPRPVGEADADRLCPGPQRQGHLPDRQPLPDHGQLQRRRLGRQGDAAAAAADPPAARPDGGVPDGPHPRPASSSAAPRPCLRDLDRPLFGKTGTTSGPTNVWFVGGTPDIVAGVYLGYDQPRSLGGYAQGGRIAAPIFKQFAQTAFAGMPKIPFVAPAGIRWARIDRASGRRVLGTFPTRRTPSRRSSGKRSSRRPSRAGRSAAAR